MVGLATWLLSVGLENNAVLVAAAAALGLGQQGGTGGALKDLADTLTGLGRALQVVAGLDVASNLGTALRADGSLVAPPQLLDGALVVAQILFAGNQQDGESTAKMLNLREPLWNEMKQEK